MNDLFRMPTGIETRWFTWENPTGGKASACTNDDGRKRRPSAVLPAGDEHVLAESTGRSGVVRRIWITIPDRSEKMLRGLWIEMTWDGAQSPAVSAPLGDFFCHGLGQMATFENEFFSSPEGRSFNCVVPMPFRSEMRIVIRNTTDQPVDMLFYEVDCTFGDVHDSDLLFFHARYRRETTTTEATDFEILPKVSGKGRYLGTNISVIADQGRYFKSWWGEGEVKVFLDGDSDHPTLCGTGTEDYIGTGWGQGQYTTRYQGCQIADAEQMRYAFYRLHVPDPVFFHKEIRVTIQQIGCWDPTSMVQFRNAGTQLVHGDSEIDMEAAIAAKGYGLFERQDDWSSVAYLYLNRPQP